MADLSLAIVLANLWPSILTAIIDGVASYVFYRKSRALRSHGFFLISLAFLLVLVVDLSTGIIGYTVLYYATLASPSSFITYVFETNLVLNIAGYAGLITMIVLTFEGASRIADERPGAIGK